MKNSRKAYSMCVYISYDAGMFGLPSVLPSKRWKLAAKSKSVAMRRDCWKVKTILVQELYSYALLHRKSFSLWMIEKRTCVRGNSRVSDSRARSGGGGEWVPFQEILSSLFATSTVTASFPTSCLPYESHQCFLRYYFNLYAAFPHNGFYREKRSAKTCLRTIMLISVLN